MPLKIASWNIEYADKLLKDTTPSGRDRQVRVRQTIKDIKPDILCVVEGPRGEQGAVDFGTNVLGGDYEPVLLQGPGEAIGYRDRDYANNMAGIQWIWFYVKPALKDRCVLQAPSVWQEMNGYDSWPVYYWGKPDEKIQHKHYRHPQVLKYRFDNGDQLELIGVHLKSGFMEGGVHIEKDADGNLIGPNLDEALSNRIKLATEARDVRTYISKRFAEESIPPPIIVVGDMNDGEGQDYFEKNYLYFSVVSNLEGDVVDSEQFFNHALFDFTPSDRWSIKFADEVLGLTADQNPLLLVHILMSQPVCNGSCPVTAKAHCGIVEHKAYNDNNPSGKKPTSDHRPVSVVLK